MAITPEITFTALPNGRDSTSLKLSVFVTHRLGAPGQTLADYDFSNWVDRVSDLAAAGTLRVQFGPNAPLVKATIDGSALDSALWNTLLPPNTSVAPFSFKDNSARPLRSFSVSALEDYIDSVYTAIGNDSPVGFPDLKAPGPLN